MLHSCRVSRLVRLAVSLAGSLSLTLLTQCDDPTKGQTKASAAAPVAVSSAQAAAASQAGAVFSITPQNSKVEWTASKITASHDGGFTSFSGSITLVGGAIDQSRVSVDIDTASVFANPDKLAGHLKTPDFFAVETFPKASFASTSVKVGGDKGAGFQVTGNLTLHGVTKSISFPANIAAAGNVINADATFSINRKDFNINYPGKVDDLIRDDVLIKLTLHPTKQS